MTASFHHVQTTAHFDRLVRKLAPKHPDLIEGLEEAIEILAVDPYNKGRNYPIKKLQGVPAMASTGFVPAASVSAMTFQGKKSRSITAGCGARTPTELAWRSCIAMAIQ